MGNPFGRNTVIPLTNKSGGSVAAGDFVYIDTANNDSFTTGTTSGYAKGIGIAQQSIASNAVGLVLVNGYAALVNVNASVTRGNFLKGYTVVKQGTDAGSSRGAGTCGMFLTGGTTPDAIIWQPDLGAGSGENVATSTIWDAAGDLAVGSGADTAAKLPIGTTRKNLQSNGTTATWAYPAFIGAKAYRAGTQTIGSGAIAALALDTEEYDSDAFHDNSTNNSRFTVPTGLGGKYRLTGSAWGASGLGSGVTASSLYWAKNGSANQIRGSGDGDMGTANNQPCVTVEVDLAAGDYVELCFFNGTAGNVVIGHASAASVQTTASVALIGV